MRRILVPCDFSYTAKQAYTLAIELAEKTGAELFVLYVIDMPFSYESAYAAGHYYHETALLKELQNDAAKNFEQLSKGTARHINQHFSTLQGPVTRTILTFVENEDIDLVVMGTNGASGMKEYLLGSNTEKVIRFSTVPVLSIRELCGLRSIRNVVFPTDLVTVNNDLITHLQELQDLLGFKLHIVYVSTEYHLYNSNEIMKKLELFAEDNSLRNYTLNIQSDDDNEKGIVGFAREVGADMIAIATHGRRGLAHLFAGSLAEDIANHVHCPVWSYSIHNKTVPNENIRIKETNR